MAVTVQTLYAYTNQAANVGDVDVQAIQAYTNIAAEVGDILAQALQAFTNAGPGVGDVLIQALLAYTNVISFTDINDPLEVQLLDTSLDVEHILRGK